MKGVGGEGGAACTCGGGRGRGSVSGEVRGVGIYVAAWNGVGSQARAARGDNLSGADILGNGQDGVNDSARSFHLGPASMPVVPDSDVGFVATFSRRSSSSDSDEEEDSESSESLLALPEGLLPPAAAARPCPAAGAPCLGGVARAIAGAPDSAAEEEVKPLGRLCRCCCCRRRSEVPAASAPKAADVACGMSMTTGLTAGSP